MAHTVNRQPKPGDVIQGTQGRSFYIEEPIAVGGRATVWKATVLNADGVDAHQEAAIKTPLNSDCILSLREEVNVLQRLWDELPARLPRSSIALVEPIDFGDHPEFGYFIAMEYYDRTSLNLAYATEGKKVPEAEIDRVLQAIAPTLDAAHALEPPVCHYDLKPSNILLNTQGDVALTDFSPSGYGNAHYMAPEVIRYHIAGEGQDQIDHRADIYSLGVTIYRSLFGEYPVPISNEIQGFEAREQEAYRQLIVEKVPIPVRTDISRALYLVLERALQRGRRRRYQSVKQMADAFSNARIAGIESRVASGSGDDIIDPPQPEAPEEERKRPLWVIMIGAVCTIFVLISLLGPKPTPVPPEGTSVAAINATASSNTKSSTPYSGPSDATSTPVDPTDTPRPTITMTRTYTPTPRPTSTYTPRPSPTATSRPPLPAGCPADRQITSPWHQSTLEAGTLIEIEGSARASSFSRYLLEFASGADPGESDEFSFIEDNSEQIKNSQLGKWNTNGLPPGIYTLRLKVVKPDSNWYNPPCNIVVELE